MPEIPLQPVIAVVGLGYVGLPLALAFSRRFPTVGFDVDAQRIAELKRALDRTGEVDEAELRESGAEFSAEPSSLLRANTFIVTVPTPVDSNNVPDLAPLRNASAVVGGYLRTGCVVIYESTVYPGATEEVCVPELERASGLRFNVDFSCGYSPERINPGDRRRRLADIVKITSGSTPRAADYVDGLYRSIISAGTHRAPDLRTAEAAKVVENVQRDVNIALVNELAQIFRHLGMDTGDVLEAAATKWNFMPFRPGLVGGHCIGVDPYYLVNRAQQAGYFPELISASRRINESMGRFVSSELMRIMTQRRIHVVDSRILVLGLAFKENCRDLRNTKVSAVVAELAACNARVDVHDPLVDPGEARDLLGMELVRQPGAGEYDAVLLAVAHESFLRDGIDGIRRLLKPGGVVFDVKSAFRREEVDGRL